MLTYVEGADVDRLEARLEEEHGLSFPNYARPNPPGRLVHLDAIGSLLIAVAAFFAVLGVAGLVHALTTSVAPAPKSLRHAALPRIRPRASGPVGRRQRRDDRRYRRRRRDPGGHRRRSPGVAEKWWRTSGSSTRPPFPSRRSW